MDALRIRFERLYRSVHGNKHSMSRTYLGYADPSVDSAYFFWKSGIETGAGV